ncbi:MAG: hypothetical protein ACM3KM_02995 [Acidobacteriaceae bacterium]
MKSKKKTRKIYKTKRPQTLLAEIDDFSVKTIRRGGKLATKLVKAVGIPEAYSETVAWFAERMVLAFVCIATAAFVGGVLFTLYLSQPIADSPAYAYLEHQTQLAKAQIIDLTSPMFGKLVADNRQGEVVAVDVIGLRKEQVRQYLLTKKSPLADDEEALSALAASKNMKLILAISFVESNFGKHCYYYNCSGIGGSVPNLRRYNSYAEWIQDFDKLLEERYNNMPIERFVGLYVQPDSPNWLYGVRQVLKEFDEFGIG